MFHSFLARTMEYQGWGWNELTISFIVTLLFATAEASQLIVEMRTISRAGKAVSMPNVFFNYFGGLLLVLGLYGLIGEEKVSLAMASDGVLGIFFYIPMWYFLHKYKGFTKLDWTVLIGSLLMVPVIWILPGLWKGYVLAGFAMLAVFAAMTWPYELWKTKKRGQVEVGLLIVYILNVGVWMVYGFAAHIVPLMIVTPFGVSILAVAIVLWYKAKK